MSTILSEEFERKISDFLSKFKIIPVATLLCLILFFVFFFHNLSQQSVFAVQEYQLPYPGILPDNPLYPAKVVRDRMMEFFTREPLKKSELYLLFADKRINMAQFIRQTNWSLTEETASKAEKYLLKLQDSLVAAKNMGLTPTGSFIKKVKLAGKAHNKILKSLKKSAPSEFKNKFDSSILLNEQFQGYSNGL
ncbi:MAG: DUF5667 domain-containing protein [Patescibacteria group bacterium]|jgi:hypothetical protein